MTPTTRRAPRGYNRAMHPVLQHVAETRQRAADLRTELVAAEREHNDAILAALDEPNPATPGQPLFSVQQIADAAGTSRAPIYKRRDRRQAGGEYGARPQAVPA